MRSMIIAGLVLAALTSVRAGERQKSSHRACHVKCPNCEHVCNVTISLEKVKHHCYMVECKKICIPPITFPWQIGCDTGCNCPNKGCPESAKDAKIKTVRVLKKFEFECERCKYKWTPACDKCGCESCGAGTCSDACSDATDRETIVPVSRDFTIPEPKGPKGFHATSADGG